MTLMRTPSESETYSRLMPFALYRTAGAKEPALLDWTEADYRPGYLYECPNCGAAVKAVSEEGEAGFEHMLSSCDYAYESAVKIALNRLFGQQDAIELPQLKAEVFYISTHNIEYRDEKILELSRMEPVLVNLGINPQYHCSNPVWELKIGPYQLDLLLVVAFEAPTAESALWEFKKHNKMVLELNLQDVNELTIDELRDILGGKDNRLRWLFHPKKVRVEEELAALLVESVERRESQIFIPENSHLVAQASKQLAEQLSVNRDADPVYQAICNLSAAGQLNYFTQNMGVDSSVFLPTWLDVAVEHEDCFIVSRYVWQAALAFQFIHQGKQRGLADELDVESITRWLAMVFGCEFDEKNADKIAVCGFLDKLAEKKIIAKYGPRYYRRTQFLGRIV